MVPWFERPIIYDVRAQPNIVQSTSGSRDLQMVRPARSSGAGCVRAARSLAAAARRAPACVAPHELGLTAWLPPR